MSGNGNYKEESISGSKWTRCRVVTCINPLDPNEEHPRKVWFQEENVMSVGGGEILSLGDVGAVSATFEDAGTFPLLNPLTGEELGSSMTHSELYVALYSLYIQAAKARDSALSSGDEEEEGE